VVGFEVEGKALVDYDKEVVGEVGRMREEVGEEMVEG